MAETNSIRCDCVLPDGPTSASAAMKVLVTGAAGFIGMHVAQRLLDRGDKVVGLDNLNEYYDVNLKLARLAELRKHRCI